MKPKTKVRMIVSVPVGDHGGTMHSVAAAMLVMETQKVPLDAELRLDTEHRKDAPFSDPVHVLVATWERDA